MSDNQTSPSKAWRPATRQLHAGLERTEYGETSEALFLTSGFVYDNAEQAAKTFTGEVTHYQYSRFGNPTTAALEARLADLEGAEACVTTATGMGLFPPPCSPTLRRVGVLWPPARCLAPATGL